ncbi:methyltransferase domain-containing protein [Hyphomonas sp.]|uniref:class I SAM-dependent methyltransferase n=1 Tax=Hyphomonas sp. TaxID=87 RepID=UPI0030F7D025
MREENALSMSFPDAMFDGAYIMHVGMNIEDKAALFAEVFRVLRPGARFGIYDIMRTGPGELAYPVPWAGSPATSFLADTDTYKTAMQAAGFVVSDETSRRDFALEFFRNVRVANQANGGPPPLGLHTLMQHTAAAKVGNLVKNISAGLIAPVELIATKP